MNNTGDDMLTRMKDRNFRELVYLINKPPRWNEQVGAYVLNFNGRVTMASVKNFQLVDPEEQNTVVLQVNTISYHLILNGNLMVSNGIVLYSLVE